MLTFLFWNLDGKPLQHSLAKLAERHQVDVLILAECAIPQQELLTELNRPIPNPTRLGFRPPDSDSLCERVVIYPRFPTRRFKRRAESAYYTGRVLSLPGRESVILFAVHFGSKLYRSDASQSLALPGFSQLICDEEKRAGHTRTLIVGDLNMNPFEAGVVGAEGLNAAMTRETAAQVTRQVGGADFPFFYNPMWSHFGDSSHEIHPPGSPDHEPPGTCYHRAAESCWYYWNMFDQVLLRPSLLQYFRNSELRILVTDGDDSFLDQLGRPDRERFSDHLPILFRLHL
jgi:hypothetical protein